MAHVDPWTTSVLAAGHEHLRIPGFRLTVVRGPDKGKEQRATSSELVVGTQEASDLRLTDPTVSRSHFSLETRPDGFRLRDLGSTNGTVVAGMRVLDAIVAPDVEIEAGESRLRLQTIKDALEIPLYSGDHFGPLIGQSLPMRQLFALLERVAATLTNVLILGETGTGKDLAAEAIHLASPRADGPFVVLDCSSIPENLMESELFGHEKGAFTGAVTDRVGVFESAHGGTVFLDEVGELPLHLQPKLLRVLERRSVRRVGSNVQKQVDVRVIAATNRDLRGEVNRGNFREDLFFRLSVITARMPPLRDRSTDIALLAKAFLHNIAPNVSKLPHDLLTRLTVHRWPGNVRELRNAVERAVALGDNWALHDHASPTAGRDELHVDATIPFKEAKQHIIERFERPYLAALLELAGGNVSEAARRADIDRVHLLKLLRRYALR